MSTAIAPVNGAALAVPAEPFFSPEQERIILNSYLGGATKEEATVLLATVQRRRLDPFSRQVYFVKRWDAAKREEVWAIQTSIDGLRSIADRTGRYEGQTPAYWCGPDGEWVDVWLDKQPPAAAKVGVYKAGFREPIVCVARLATYQQTKKDGTPTQFWSKMPDLMLAKCAEALALRKAFPEDTGGLYVAEEMGNDAQEAPASVAPRKPEPEVARTPDPQEEVNARNGAAQLAAAAEELQGVVMADPVKAKMVWKRADRLGMTPPMFGKFVERVLGTKKPSAEWTADDLAALERAVTEEESGDIRY